jgi:putative tricarboxylic transport membrane protein
LAAVLLLLSVILVAFQVGRSPAPVRSEVGEEGKPSTARRTAIIISLLAWALLMPLVGFFTTSLTAFLVLIAIASFEPLAPRVMGLYALYAAVIVGAFHLLMSRVLNLRMPDGLLF